MPLSQQKFYRFKMNIMLDTNIFDSLSDNPGLISALTLLQENQKVIILTTPIQED